MKLAYLLKHRQADEYFPAEYSIFCTGLKCSY